MTQSDSRQIVAVAYGRDVRAKDAIESFLSDLGLVPLSFDQALLRTAGMPTTIGAVRSLFKGVKAAVVIMTPDDLAITHPDLSDGGRADAHYAGQPRQNVLIETGMAITALPARTILVRFGEVRPASNLDGLTLVNLGAAGSAQRLARLLQRAKCEIAEERIEHARIPGLDQLVGDARSREHEPQFGDRGVSIFEAARSTGLRDIEHRTRQATQLSPGVFYAKATAEVAISAVTASSTFQQYDKELRSLLLRGVAVKILILDPATPDMARVSRRERRDLAGDVRDVYEAIKRGGLATHRNFAMRLAPFLYPFGAVMLDGDIAHPPSDLPEDLDRTDTFAPSAEIRVQPGGYYTTAHEGPILQFHATAEPGPFHHFASDLRRQWSHATPVDLATLAQAVDAS